MKPDTSLLCALDLGSSKVAMACARVTKRNSQPQLEWLGMAEKKHQCVKHGVVIDIIGASQVIAEVKKELESQTGVTINEVICSVAGSHVKAQESKGMVTIRHKEVTSDDIQRVLDSAKTVHLPQDRHVLHVIAREFQVDFQQGIVNPLGMTGVRLEVSASIVTASKNVIQNNLKALEKAGLKAQMLIYSGLASGESVLSPDEKNLGVCLAEVGSYATDLSYFSGGSLVAVSQIHIGGQHFTHDVAIGLRTNSLTAEKIKVEKGACLPQFITDETIEISGFEENTTRVVHVKELVDILSARAEEFFKFLKQDVHQHASEIPLGCGIVITGGASHLTGFVELGEYLLDMPIRRGLPKIHQFHHLHLSRHGQYSTLMGMLLLGYQSSLAELSLPDGYLGLFSGLSVINRWSQRFRDLFQDLF